MAQLPLVLHFNPAPSPTEYVRVVARPRSNMGTVAADEVFGPPHPNPRIISVYVPTPETHEVSAYRSPDGVSLGVLAGKYDAMPAYYNSVFMEDIDLVVGRGTREDPGTPGVIIDPVSGTTEVVIPFLQGKTVARIYRESVTRYMRPEEYSLLTSGNQPGLRLLSAGDTFYAGEAGGDGFRIVFAPYYENNTGQAIFDLTALITNHLNNQANPHLVTKAQVGLGLLPNAKSDSYQLDDSNSLASSKAVHDLWAASNDAKIIGFESIFVGNVGAVTVGGKIASVVNNGFDTKITVDHGRNISGPYMVWVQVMGRSEGASGGWDNWNNDNDVIATVGNKFSANEFDIFLHKLANTTTSITCRCMLLRTS